MVRKTCIPKQHMLQLYTSSAQCAETGPTRIFYVTHRSTYKIYTVYTVPLLLSASVCVHFVALEIAKAQHLLKVTED